MNDRNLLWRVSHRELKIVPTELPPARFRDPKERSRRDRLALIAIWIGEYPITMCLCHQLERDLWVGMDICHRLR